jgi:hypothetical protein
MRKLKLRMRILLASICTTMIVFSGCSHQRTVLVKESLDDGVRIKSSYYISDEHKEVLHGKKTIRSFNMYAEEEYRDGKLTSSKMKSVFR